MFFIWLLLRELLAARRLKFSGSVKAMDHRVKENTKQDALAEVATGQPTSDDGRCGERRTKAITINSRLEEVGSSFRKRRVHFGSSIFHGLPPWDWKHSGSSLLLDKHAEKSRQLSWNRNEMLPVEGKV